MKIHTTLFLLVLSGSSFAAVQTTDNGDQTLFVYKLGFYTGCAHARIKQGGEEDDSYRYCACCISVLNRYLTEEEWAAFMENRVGKEGVARLNTLLAEHNEEIVQCRQ